MSRYRSIRLHATAAPLHAPIESAIKDFLLYHERKGDSPSYLQELHSYLIGGGGKYGTKRIWKPLLPWTDTEGLSRVDALTKEMLGAYLDHVRNHASRSDYGRVCVILKRLLGYWMQEQYLAALPMSIPHPKRFKAEINVFTLEEMHRLQSVVRKENVRDWAIFMLLLDTGMRAGELCNLRLDDVRWDRQELIIRPAIAKNRSYRIIPLHSSLRALRRYADVRGRDTNVCDRLFLAYYSTPVVGKGERRRNLSRLVFCAKGLTRVGLFQLVQKWGRLANITEARCSPHVSPFLRYAVPKGWGRYCEPSAYSGALTVGCDGAVFEVCWYRCGRTAPEVCTGHALHSSTDSGKPLRLAS